MTRSILIPPAVFALLTLAATGAWASGIPSAALSTTPDHIRLVRSTSGLPDAVAGQFKIVARDVINNPIFECLVVIDLSNCPDLTVCSDQLDPDALTSCATKTIRKSTSFNGEVTFTLLGGSNGAGHASSLAHSARIYGNGNLIATPSVSSFDLDGLSGVGAGDLSAWITDFGSGMDWARSDYDGDGRVGAGDLSEWLTVFGAGTSTQSCSASCP